MLNLSNSVSNAEVRDVSVFHYYYFNTAEFFKNVLRLKLLLITILELKLQGVPDFKKP